MKRYLVQLRYQTADGEGKPLYLAGATALRSRHQYTALPMNAASFASEEEAEKSIRERGLHPAFFFIYQDHHGLLDLP